MAHELIPITNETELKSTLGRGLVDGRTFTDPAILCDLGAGLLRFTDAAFNGADESTVLAQRFDREADGRGAHFDVYQGLVSDEFPWIGVYNLSGNSNVKVTELPVNLKIAYDEMYPRPTDDAMTARRHFSALALNAPWAEVYTGQLVKGTGMLLPQGNAHIVHDVTPTDAIDPGQYVKMLVVESGNTEAEDLLEEKGYLPLDEFIIYGLSSGPGTAEPVRVRREFRDDSFDHGTWNREKRDCNLD